MYYLLDVLTGEARESLKQFEVSGRTYALAVEHHKKKYGNKQLLVGELVDRLGECRARTERLEDQRRRLYEKTSPIVIQTEIQGEVTDSSKLQRLILSKFAEPVQRHALRKKQEIKEGEHGTRRCSFKYCPTKFTRKSKFIATFEVTKNVRG
ncbi:unnamed protein product [Haemonchus placei]|uniref:Transposase n=1 Tax=Haemonchus placei TaxID=6290 RepID=A0A0N4X5E4_HAEPC|nr:unnamed protein product [Haemonchus placei]